MILYIWRDLHNKYLYIKKYSCIAAVHHFRVAANSVIELTVASISASTCDSIAA